MKKSNTILLNFFLLIMMIACTESGRDIPTKNTETAIQKNLLQMSAYAEKKEIDSFLAMFDDSENILLVGSDSSEIRSGKNEISGLVKEVMSKPYRIHWDFTDSKIYSSQNVAWAFSNKNIILEFDSGEKTISPYRLTTVWIKKGDQWKIRLFNGSVPGKG